MLACLCLVNLFANSAYSSIAPFYPIEAVKKGVPTSLHGIVFAAYSISMAIFSPLFARMLNSHGPKRMLIMGCICEGVSMIVFGLFDFVEGPTAYAICSFSCRFLEGFGFGCLNSSCKYSEPFFFINDVVFLRCSFENCDDDFPGVKIGAHERNPTVIYWLRYACWSNPWLVPLQTGRLLAAFLHSWRTFASISRC